MISGKETKAGKQAELFQNVNGTVQKVLGFDTTTGAIIAPLSYATATTEGIVSSAAQIFGGLKTFNAGIAITGGTAAAGRLTRTGTIWNLGNSLTFSETGVIDLVAAGALIIGNTIATSIALGRVGAPVSVVDTTASSSSVTGALKVSGGLGVAGAIFAGTSVNGATGAFTTSVTTPLYAITAGGTAASGKISYNTNKIELGTAFKVSDAGAVTGVTTLSATTVTANLTGNVTGNCTGSSGSCTGNAATATTSGSCTGNAATSSSCTGNAATSSSCTGNAATSSSCTGNAATSSSCTGNAATATTATNLFGGSIQGVGLARFSLSNYGSGGTFSQDPTTMTIGWNLLSGAGDIAFITGNTYLPVAFSFSWANTASATTLLGHIGRDGSWSKPGGGEFSNSSDMRLKRNIRPLLGGLDLICALSPRSFEWRDNTPDAREPVNGFVADEVMLVCPNWVKHDGIKTVTEGAISTTYNDVKSVSLDASFNAYLVAAIKELKARVDTIVAT
jgi:hypothetical protein